MAEAKVFQMDFALDKLVGELAKGSPWRRFCRPISLRYDEELSMEAIGRQLGVCRMAISKQLRTLNRKLNRAVV